MIEANTPTIEIEEINDNHFVATIPALGTSVTGSTRDEALNNALRAIIARRIAQAEKSKQRHGKDHGVA